jgi:hypothetical protein
MTVFLRKHVSIELKEKSSADSFQKGSTRDFEAIGYL